jgi:hypothetical protein
MNWALDNRIRHADHAAVKNPGCNLCGQPAAIWQRCRCREWIARCPNHQPRTVAQLRREHECK